MDKELEELIKNAKLCYPDSDVIKAYEFNYMNYDIKELKRNLKIAISKKQ